MNIQKSTQEYEQWIGKHLKLIPADLKLKHQAMVSSPSRSVAAPKAAKMAASTIDDIGDRTLPRDEQQRRKRTLIQGPKEFREIRRK